MANNHKKYLTIAKEIGKLSDFYPHKIGCIIVYKNSIISSGFNSNKTHTMQYRYNKFRNLTKDTIISKVHAEIAAISKIKYLDIDWKKVTIYINRKGRNGVCGLARPCASCMEAIREMGIQKIVYSSDLGYAIERIKNEQ